MTPRRPAREVVGVAGGVGTGDATARPSSATVCILGGALTYELMDRAWDDVRGAVALLNTDVRARLGAVGGGAA